MYRDIERKKREINGLGFIGLGKPMLKPHHTKPRGHTMHGLEAADMGANPIPCRNMVHIA